MLPIKLIIEGLYSYQTRQIIDFSELTAGGLFGIFGSVGSGKSSILEAITFALFGDSDRLGGSDFSYNMMNLKSNKFFIEFEFQNYEFRIFKIQKEYRRNKSDFLKVTNAFSIISEFKNNSWIPIEHPNHKEYIKEILGNLNAQNFRRTIIIPQGKFKEFIELTPVHRTNMLKEIFPKLSEFDLQKKTSDLLIQTTASLNQLQGQLVGFESVSEEKIQELKNNLNLLNEDFKQKENQFKTLSEYVQLLKNLKFDFELLNAKKSEWEKLSIEKDEIDQLDQKLKTYEKIYHAFFNVLQQLEQNQLELTRKNNEYATQQDIFHKTKLEFEEINAKFQEIQPKFHELDQTKRKASDLKLIRQIHENSKQTTLIKTSIEKGLKLVSDEEMVSNNLQDELKAIENQIETISEKLLDETILMEIGNWFQQQKLYEADKKRFDKEISTIKEQIQEIDQAFVSQGINLETFYLHSDEALGIWEENYREKESHRNHLLLQEKLSEFSNQLQDGDPCPLCGANEHPNPSKIENVSEELAALQKEFVEMDEYYQNWKKIREKVDQEVAKKQFHEKNLDRILEESHLLNIQIESHFEKFDCNDFDPKDSQSFEEFKNQQIQQNKAIKELQIQEKNLRLKLDENRVRLTSYKELLDKYKLEESTKNSEIATLKNQIQVLDFTTYQDSETSEIQKQIQEIDELIAKIETNYFSLQNQHQILAPTLASQEASLQSIKNRIEEIQLHQENLNSEIKTNLVEFGFESIQDIQQILAEKLDIDQLQNKIQNYRIDIAKLSESIQELETKLAGKQINEEEFEAENLKLIEAEKAYKLATEEVAKQTAEIERLEKEFAQKADLLKQQSELEKREENLKTLTNLFKGAGFVQYVSSIYLRQLCDTANVRFHRMTRNQLSLQLSEKGDFEIIDYLNEGRSRSVKTLSGGQAFQASLSLALALAESVQSQAKSDKNFFFIDEGFGTQDTESVNIVFETLTSLQKENRIVGIISHVEELKERIPRALTITNDDQLGSLIEMT